MTLKKFKLALALAGFMSLAGNAQTTFIVNGIKYMEDLSDPTRMAVIVMPNYDVMNPMVMGYEGDIVIPSKVEHDLDTYDVIGISTGAFCSDKLNSLVISEGVCNIAQGAIYSISLKKLVLPSTVKSISMIGGCNLEDIDFGNGIESINMLMLGPVKSLRFPDSLKSIEVVSRVPGPNNIETNREGNLTDLTFGKNIESIKFFGVDYLGSELKIPSSCKKISTSFPSCPNLVKLELPAGLEILSESFASVDKLENLSIPGSIKNITNDFSSCISLKKLTINEGVENIEDSFVSMPELTDLSLPNSVINIIHSFRGCDNIKTLVIPESVADIKDSFSATLKNTEEIIFKSTPKNVTMFSYVSVEDGKTKKIYLPWKEVPQKRFFLSLGDGAVLELYVPKGMTQTFTDDWSLEYEVEDGNVKIIEMP